MVCICLLYANSSCRLVFFKYWIDQVWKIILFVHDWIRWWWTFCRKSFDTNLKVVKDKHIPFQWVIALFGFNHAIQYGLLYLIFDCCRSIMKRMMVGHAPLCSSQILVQTAMKMNWRKSCPSELYSLIFSENCDEIKCHHIVSFTALFLLGLLLWKLMLGRMMLVHLLYMFILERVKKIVRKLLDGGTCS